MSDSDEIITSDEESSNEDEIATSDAAESGDDDSEVDDSRNQPPSRELTVEDSDVSSDGDESMIVANRNKGKKKKRKAVIESDSELEEEEEELEERAFSPRTRMSITGIRPADLTDDSSEIEYSDDEGAKKKSNLSNISEVYNDDEGGDGGSGIETEDEEEDNEKTNSFIEKSAEEKSDIHSSTMNQTDGNASRSEMASNSEIEESSSGKNSSTISPKVVGNTMGGNVNSPQPPRYSIHFAKEIQDKLSSTLYQPREVEPEIDSSADSDIQIIEKVEKPIELSSDDAGSEEDKENKTHINTTQKNLVQPKILSALNNVAPAMKTPMNKGNLRHVSQEYYDKEIRKFEEMKSELINAEKLLEKISKSLPDGGRQLSLRIERLRNDVSIKSKYIASLYIEDAPGASGPIFPPDDKDSPSQKLQDIQKQRKAFFNNNAAPNWDDLSAAVNQIQPTHTGKQGMATFNNQKVLTMERLKVIKGNTANP